MSLGSPGSAQYAFGEDSAGAWLKVGPAPVRAADETWLAEARTEAALFGARFVSPGRRDEAAFLGRAGADWELAFRPEGGSTLTFLIGARTRRPTELDVQDLYSRLVACEDVSWARRTGGGAMVPEAMRCRTVNGGLIWGEGTAPGHRTLEARFRLSGASVIDRPPAWAREPRDRPAARGPVAPHEIAIADPRRLRVDLATERGESASFVLDSGATFTAMDGPTARAFGVVPTGEAPLLFRPPWLPEHRSWIGVVDRLRAGPIEIDGARVLVMEQMEGVLDGAGLLGLDFFRRFVVEVDSPAGMLRLHGRSGYRPPPEATRIAMVGSWRGVEVDGEVKDVARGAIVLDTGAALDVVVHAPELVTKHRRRRGTDAFLGPRDSRTSPDYWTEIAGLRVGPFEFPATPAIGRDRERARLGGGIALVGMGVLRHLRLAFDCTNRRLWASPGSSYSALLRAGLEIEDQIDGPRVSWVVEGGPAEAAGLRAGDLVRTIDGVAVATARTARERITRRRDVCRLGFRRASQERSATLALLALDP